MKYLKEYYEYSNDLYITESILSDLKDKINSLSSDGKKKMIRYSLLGLISVVGIDGAVDKMITSVDQSNIDNKTEVVNIIKDTAGEIKEDKPEVEEKVEKESRYKKGYDFILSQAGWDFIRKEEKLKLKAYDIGDGMITVGWGHAEEKDDTKLKKGDKISREQAQKYLKKDLTKAADGIRRIFKQWEEKGIDVEITQGMFDALVSLAFNSGIGGVRSSDFIQALKKGDYDKTYELIKKHKLSEEFPGLEKRRIKEAELFLK